MILFLANGSFEGGNARIIDKNLKNNSGYHLSPDNLNNKVSTFNGNSSRFDPPPWFVTHETAKLRRLRLGSWPTK